jgi:hypothetical protein
MASMARIQQREFGQWSGLLKDFIAKWSALESDWRNSDESRRRQQR